ncbi:MAG: hypothetical protein K2R98_04100 [Gemmataceae bacterium]|nr:hypothetical protein [Gemmataceae bacterium]
MHTPKFAEAAPSNGAQDVERLAALVKALEVERDELRASLAKAETERDWYLKAVYEYARKEIGFADADVEELRKTSAGPVELLP